MGTGGGKGEGEAHWYGGAEGSGGGPQCLGGGERGGPVGTMEGLAGDVGLIPGRLTWPACPLLT